MRNLMFILLAILFSAPLASAQTRATAWEGKGADGRPVKFDPDHMKRPALLLFWATWCPYCEALMPNLQHVYDDAGKAHLDVYAIDIKDDGDPLAALAKRKQTFTLIRDGDAIADQYGVRGTPGVFLVDVKGNVVYHPMGGQPAEIEAKLRENLHLKPAS